MRAFPAAVLSIVIGAAVCGPGVAQILPPAAPQQGAPPAVAPAAPAPAPPPTVLLPPGASDTAPASDEAPARPKEPAKPVRRTSAILQALDKTTAETLRFEAPIGQPIRYKDLIFVVHACEDAAPELGHAGAAAHMEIQSSPRPIPGRVTPPTRQLFRGWMFANAPGLHPFEHPVYDAWLIGCRGAAPASAPATP